MKKNNLLHESTQIEVVLRKEMTYGEYLNIITSTRNKGWNIQAYQTGYYSDGLKEKA